MAESVSSHGQSEIAQLSGPYSLGSAVDPQGLSTVQEVPYNSAINHGNGSLDNRVHSKIPARGTSGEASLDGSIQTSQDEKQLEQSPRCLYQNGRSQGAVPAWHRSTGLPSPSQNGNGIHRSTELDRLSAKPTSPKKEKKGGLRNTLRRMFGRRSTTNRISAPNPAGYPRHDPGEFITSATDIMANRAASMPAQGVSRTSGLRSHPPFEVAPSPPAVNIPTSSTPPPPERHPPERPVRPRRASVPSLLLNKQEIEAVDAATTKPGLQTTQKQQAFDAENIGFAVTNGCNPRRRSRSVGAYQDAEHRMSPIQWRRWRRRSDEIRYWRASSDLTSIGIKGLDSPSTAQKGDNGTTDEDEGALGEQKADFNFGLQGDNLQDHERIGLEERIVTLEIKLMDFEYAISKMQAESASPSRRYSHPVGAGRDSANLSFDQVPASRGPPLMELQRTPSTISSQWVKDMSPHPRPISVATTLKPGHAGQTGLARKESVDRSTRSSLTGLTIDHYTTLITLMRNEQSARQRLEKQVSILQGRLDAMSAPQSSHSQGNSISQHSYSRSLSSSQRRQAFVDLRGGKPMRHTRPRSSSYSTNDTDTEDDAFHDVYVTPNITPVERERGEYERGPFDRIAGVEEGLVF